MIDIGRISLVELLPQNLRADPDAIAAAVAVDGFLQTYAADTYGEIIFSNIDALDGMVLDRLAYDLHVDFYDPAYDQLASIDMATMMVEELDGLDAGFERIKIPSAGSTVFEVPGEDPGEPEAVKEFSAVILYHHPLFAYYKSKYTGGNNPPDCGSYDGAFGQGDPGGNCKSCPNNQFGTGENGSKACKNRRRIYVLREGEIFPLLLSLPTGSLKELTRYLKRLLSKS